MGQKHIRLALLDVAHFLHMRQWYAVRLKGKKLSQDGIGLRNTVHNDRSTADLALFLPVQRQRALRHQNGLCGAEGRGNLMQKRIRTAE